MKTSTDDIIEKIDSELLNLFNASQKQSEYHFFDFYDALVMFNEGVLREETRKEYFKLKVKHYNDVFRDLLFTESKVTFVKYVSYDSQKRTVKLKVRTYRLNEVEDTETTVEQNIDSDTEHEYLKKNITRLKDKTPVENRLNKYIFLLENCKVVDGSDSGQIGITLYSFEKKFKDGFSTLFSSYHFDLRIGMTFEMYIQSLQFQSEMSVSEVDDNQLSKKNPYTNLDEVFINISDIDKCINVLRKVDPPIIDENGQFLGKNKGAFVIWIDELRRKGKLHTINDKFLPELLIEKFPGLTISASLFRQPPGRADDMYRRDFQALI